MDCPSTSVCTAPSLDGYDFHSDDPWRRDARPPVATSDKKFGLRLLPRRDKGWVRPFQDRSTNPDAPQNTCACVGPKKKETQPATARNLRFVGLPRVSNQRARTPIGAPTIACARAA